MRGLLSVSAALVSLALPARALDVDSVVRIAAENQRENERRVPLLYEAEEVSTDLDSSGRAGAPERRLFACSRREGRTVRQLVRVDGRAPTEKEIRKARGETDDVKTGRLDLMDMLPRFDFRYVRDDVVDGRPSWVMEFTPRAGRPAKSARDRVLGLFAGFAWVDPGDLQVQRIAGRLTRPVRFAGGLALRLDRIEILYETERVAPGVWAPCREELRVEALAAFVFPFRRLFRLEFANWRLGR